MALHNLLSDNLNFSITYCLFKSAEFWTEKCKYFNLDMNIKLTNPFIGYLMNDDMDLLIGMSIGQSSLYESFIYAYCLYKQKDLVGCNTILSDLLPKVPTNEKPFLSAVYYYLAMSSDNIKLYLMQSFELWMGNYQALHHLLHFSCIPSVEKTNLAHIISLINVDIVKDLYWCQLAANGPVLLDSFHSNMLDEEGDDEEDDMDYTPSITTNSPPTTSSEVPITINEVESIVNEMQTALNTRCIRLHLKEFELLKNNLHILLYEGIRQFNFYCFHNALQYMNLVLLKSPSHPDAQLCYLKSLLYLQDVDGLYQAYKQLKQGPVLVIYQASPRAHDLFKLHSAPKMVSQYSKFANCMTYFAGGCYYLLIREFDLAIIAFQNCLELNNLFFDAHYCMAICHSFLSNFDKSIYEASLLKHTCTESYLPYLLIGSRYLLQKKLKIAESFLLEALQKAIPEKLPMRKIVHKLSNIQIGQTSGLFNSTIIHIKEKDTLIDEQAITPAEQDMDDIIAYITPKTYVDPGLLLGLAYLYKLSGKFQISLCYFENILRQLITRPSIGYLDCEWEKVGLRYTDKWELTGSTMSSIIVQFIQFSFLNMADIYIATQDYLLAQYYLDNVQLLDDEYATINSECLPLAFNILSYDIGTNKEFRSFVLGNAKKLMGKCWYCLGDFLKAIGCYEDAFEKIPNDKVIHGLYDDALIKLKENPPLDTQ